MEDEMKPKETINAGNLEQGKLVRLGSNRAVNFRVETQGGTVIEGIIPANEYLEVTNGGDIKSFDIKVYDSPSGPKPID